MGKKNARDLTILDDYQIPTLRDGQHVGDESWEACLEQMQNVKSSEES